MNLPKKKVSIRYSIVEVAQLLFCLSGVCLVLGMCEIHLPFHLLPEIHMVAQRVVARSELDPERKERDGETTEQ